LENALLDQTERILVSSCSVGLRKPDTEIFRLALEISQAAADQIVYFENTPMFAQIAEGLGIRSILQTDCKSTCAELAVSGMQLDEGVLLETS
jgi:FMN phosphatase YigB (HAD superfamily)